MENNELPYKGSADYWIDKTEKNGLSPPQLRFDFADKLDDIFRDIDRHLLRVFRQGLLLVVNVTVYVGLLSVVIWIASVLFTDIGDCADRLSVSFRSVNMMLREAVGVALLLLMFLCFYKIGQYS